MLLDRLITLIIIEVAIASAIDAPPFSKPNGCVLPSTGM
jgi:hypothetical protein